MENQYIGENCLKWEAWTASRFKIGRVGLVKNSRRVWWYFWWGLIPQCRLWFFLTDFEFEKSKCPNIILKIACVLDMLWAFFFFFWLFKIPSNYVAETSFPAESQFFKPAELSDPPSVYFNLFKKMKNTDLILLVRF